MRETNIIPWIDDYGFGVLGDNLTGVNLCVGKAG